MKLKLTDADFWETLPDHVKEGVSKAQKQAFAEKLNHMKK